MYIDIHSHLDLYQDSEVEEVINNAKAAGLKIIVASGISPVSNRHVIELSKRNAINSNNIGNANNNSADKYGIIRPSVGLYPIDALEIETGKKQDTDIDAEIEFIRKHKKNICAIGEIGLDYKNCTDKKMQKELFLKMIALSEEIKKPVIIHSRKAESDVIEILESSSQKKVVMHCFSGKKSLMYRARDNGWFFSIPTSVVRSEQFQLMAKEVNLSQLFCETDSPYLSPFPGKRNEPANVVESYKKIAEIKKMDLTEVANNIFYNWQRVFE